METASERGVAWGGRKDWIILGALVIFALFFRLATLMMMNTGVDERDYWFSAKALACGFPYPELTHRTTRFAVILPVALAQVLLGSHPDVYYVMPLLNVMLQAGIAYALGLKLRGRLTGFLAALGLILFPYMIRAGSQVRPEVFSITYMLLVLYLFVEYMQREVRQLAPLLWAAFLLFVAGEAKVTNLFFAPGIFLAIILYKKKLAHAFLFAGILLGLFLGETAAYAIFSPYKFGELQIIAKYHVQQDTFVVSRFTDLFVRYARPFLQVYWQLPFVLFAAAAVMYLARDGDRRISSLVLISLSFFLFITFEVSKLHPLTPAEPFINRYLSSVLPSVFLVLAYAAEGIVRRFKSKPNDSAAAYGSVLAVLTVAVLAGFSLPRLPTGLRAYINSPLHPRHHPLILNATYRWEINKAFSDGVSIVSVDDNGGNNAIQTCESFFIDSTYYRNGRPPLHKSARVGDVTYLVLTRDGARIFPDTVLAAIRSPFRVVSISAGNIALLTDQSVDGRRGPAGEDANQ